MNETIINNQENLWEEALEKITRETERIIKKKVESVYLKANLWWNKDLANEFLKAFILIWANKFESIDDLKNKDLKTKDKDDKEKILKTFQYKDNYKKWLWKKLMLSNEEINESNIGKIELLASKYLNQAISHAKNKTKFLWEEYLEEFKSPYYDKIHSRDNNIFSLIKIYLDLEKRKKHIHSKDNNDNKDNAIKSIEIAQFEIQRILALTSFFIEREKTHEYQHLWEDTDFILSKIKELKTEDNSLNWTNMWDNPLYEITLDKKLYWKKDSERNYELKDKIDDEKNKNEYQTIKFNSIDLKGKKRFNSKERTYEVNHIWIRTDKWEVSSVDKFLRKWLSSFKEVLDHKWMIFVLDDFKDAEDLAKMLAYELSESNTSWIEYPKYMQKAWNEDTSSSYNSYKWILKVPYKGKKIKLFYKLLKEVFEEKNNIKSSLYHIKSILEQEWIENDFHKIDSFLNSKDWNFQSLEELYNYFKWKFSNKSYIIEMELQFFDMQNFMKAEIDKESLAHHSHYKGKQEIKSIPIYFPSEIYWDGINKVVKNKLINHELKMQKLVKKENDLY